jgi:hypothetical protein
MPKEHQELINNLFAFLVSKGHDVFTAQIVTQSLSALRSVDKDKLVDYAEDVKEMAQMFSEVKDAPLMMQSILQLLGTQMTQSLNKIKLQDINYEEFKA